MAGHYDGEISFDDDDLDALGHDALAELENNAIQFTQAQPASRFVISPSSDYGDDFEDDDLDSEVVIDESRSTPVSKVISRRVIPGQATHSEQFRQQRHGAPSNLHASLANRKPPAYPQKYDQRDVPSQPVPTPQDESMVAQAGSLSVGTGSRVESLQRQIEEVVLTRTLATNILTNHS